METGMFAQPVFDVGMFVSRVIVDDQMYCQCFICPSVDCFQKLDRFIVAMCLGGHSPITVPSQMAVYKLFDIKRGIPPVFKGQHDVGVLFNALKTMHR